MVSGHAPGAAGRQAWGLVVAAEKGSVGNPDQQDSWAGLVKLVEPANHPAAEAGMGAPVAVGKVTEWTVEQLAESMESETGRGPVGVLTLSPGAAETSEAVGRVDHPAHEGQMTVEGGAAVSRASGCLAG